MNVSIDWGGCYLEHKLYFDFMALALQGAGHNVGILTNERINREPEIRKSLGFKPDFMYLWGEFETIGNGAVWKAQQIIDHDIAMHHDDEASDIKKWTTRWIMKTMNSSQPDKF